MRETKDLETTSLPELVKRVASLVPRLVRDEVRSFQLEVVGKLKDAGVGIGLITLFLSGAGIDGRAAVGGNSRTSGPTPPGGIAPPSVRR
jgi:hypothetical protein